MQFLPKKNSLPVAESLPSLGVVIVAWNSGEELTQCLTHLLRDHDKDTLAAAGATIVVVDNGSNDGSVAAARASLGDKVNWVRLDQNEGFARACNLGAMTGAWEFILFLNPDAIISLGEALQLCAEMKHPEHSSFAIFGPRLRGRDGQISRSCSRFPSPGNLLASSLGLGSKAGPRMADWDHNESRRVDQVIGAAFLIRGNVFRNLHGFDERFFVYYEEVDLCYRAHLAGHHTRFTTSVTAVHTGGGSSKNAPSRRIFYVLRSRILYAQKHFGFASRWFVIFATLWIEPVVRTFAALFRNGLAEGKAGLRVWRQLLDWFLTSRAGCIQEENRKP